MAIVSTSPSPSSRPGAEVVMPGITDRQSPPSGFIRNPYRGVVLALLLVALLGAVVAAVGGYMFVNPLFLDASVLRGLATGILIGTAAAQTGRARPPRREADASSVEPTVEPETSAAPDES